MKATKAQKENWKASAPIVRDPEYNRVAYEKLNDIARRRAVWVK
jgi:hypothetical protein